jgi:hypothetical protein
MIKGLCVYPRDKLIDLSREYTGGGCTYIEFYRWIMDEFDKAPMIVSDIPIVYNLDRDGNLIFKMINGWRISEAVRRILGPHSPTSFFEEQ